MKKIFKLTVIFVLSILATLSFVACKKDMSEVLCVHKWVETNTVIGTCSVEGKKDYKCLKCDETRSESMGFGEHTTEQVFDGEYHWQVNTCEHENTPEKIAHSLTDGVCECGFYSIDKIVENYNALTVFQQDTNIRVEIDVDGEIYFNLDFKDNVMKAEGREMAIRYIVFEDGYLYGCNLENEWSKMQATELFGNEIKLVNIFTEMLHVNPIVNLLDIDFNWIENNKWEGVFEGGGAEGKLTVSVDNGKIKQIDLVRFDSNVDNLLNLTFSYGTAEVGEVPEIDYDNVNGGGNTDGPDSPNYTFEQIVDKFGELYIFGSDLNLVMTNQSDYGYGVDIGTTGYFKNDVFYLEPMFYLNEDSIAVTGGRWIIFDGSYVYFADKDYKLVGNSELREFAKTHTNQEVMDYINDIPFDWKRFTLEEFADYVSCDDPQKIHFFPAVNYGPTIKDILGDGIEYEYLGDNTWQGFGDVLNSTNMEISVTADEYGRITKIEHYQNGKFLSRFIYEYDNAQLPELPDYKQSDEISFEQILESYNELKVFENGQNYTVSIRMEDDEEDLAIFIVEDDVVKAEVYESGICYMLIEGNIVYMSNNERWQKGDKDEFFAETFGDKGNTIGGLIEYLYFYDDTLILPEVDYEKVDINQWACELNEKDLKVVVFIENGKVKRVEHFKNSNGERLWAFNFTYGDADAGEVPTPDYENAEEMFHPSNTPIDQNLVEILNNMDNIKAFDEDNNIKFKDYFYENSEWLLTEQRWIKGNYIYSPEFLWDDGVSSMHVWEAWLILDGDKVYFGNNSENSELLFNQFNAQDFANAMFESDSIEDAKLMSGGVLRSVRSFIHYDQEGVEYTKIEDNKWQSTVDGEIITVTVENEMVVEILYVEEDTNEPIEKIVFEYGTVELPEIPDYKTE